MVMNSYGTIPATSNSHHVATSAITTTTTTNTPSQQLFDLQFAPEVHATDNQQYHHLIQQQQAALMLQQQPQPQQQQPSPPQVMYDHRRDSISSSLGTSSRRGQSKAEKRAEHNAIERARREGLNTRFQQLAHVLPNLHHDTRPSKGTIIERTLDFVKDAIQKEERYRHEIKDLRHTNRQLLKQLTHLTAGKIANSEVMDSDDDQVSIRSPSPVANAAGNTVPLPITRGSSPSSASSDASSPRSGSAKQQQQQQQQQPRIRKKHPSQSHSQHALPSDATTTSLQVTPKLETPNLQQHQQYQQQQQHLTHHHHATNTAMTQPTTTQHPSSLRQAASLSSFSSETWHPPTPNAFWPQQQSTPSIHSPSTVPFHLSAFSSLAVNPSSTSMPPSMFNEADLFNDTTQTISSSSSSTSSSLSMYPPPPPQSIHAAAAGQEDIDMKPCDFNVHRIKEEPHHTFMPTGYPAIQGLMRLSSRPSQSLSQYC